MKNSHYNVTEQEALVFANENIAPIINKASEEKIAEIRELLVSMKQMELDNMLKICVVPCYLGGNSLFGMLFSQNFINHFSF